ncbi:MAG: hypothetical protein ACO28Y_01865, partial [Bacteroidia bacterium]
MTSRITLIATCILLSVSASGQLVIKKVKPSDTDPLITTFNTDSNYVYLNASVIEKNILVIR